MNRNINPGIAYYIASKHGVVGLTRDGRARISQARHPRKCGESRLDPKSR